MSEQSSPAEAYAQFRSRQVSPLLAAFADGYGFVFDDYQREACAHVEAGSGVLVAAPTGAGKTIVGEFAVYLGLDPSAGSASTPRRSRPCPTRSTPTWSGGTGQTGSGC